MTKKPSASQLQDHLGYWLRFVSNHVSHAFTLKVEAQGATVAEWVVMREMLDSGAVNPSQLADRLGMTRGAISKLVERLCRKKLAIRRSADGDRRYQSVELTAAGKKLVPVLARLADENDRQFFGHLDAKGRATLVDMLQEIVRRHGWKDVPVS
ncbi:MAG TPA: MarR family winged helix-turn-helix transcriptional regulator [Pirellulales bacterium]|jgi:DNA-binding MarR family transcriptional regulator|nr:MarR family winged helix-turn-helix transcriptional regulator [Pirellulales bacterium]